MATTKWAEIIYILMMVSGVGLFALGGTHIPVLERGYKQFRRYLFPLVMFGLLYWLGGFKLWQILGCCISLSVVLHFPYGSNSDWWERFFTAASYGVPSMFLGRSWWILITPAVFLILFILSNWKETAKDFIWKICEGAIGFTIAASIIGAISRPW